MDKVHDAFQSGRLSCAVPSDEAHDLSGFNIERDAFEREGRIFLLKVLNS